MTLDLQAAVQMRASKFLERGTEISLNKAGNFTIRKGILCSTFRATLYLFGFKSLAMENRQADTLPHLVVIQ